MHFLKYNFLVYNLLLTKGVKQSTINMMKRKLSIFLGGALLSLFSTAPAFALEAGSACPGNGFAGLCLSYSSLGGVISSFITLGFVLVGLIALGFLVWGGIKWLTSEGDKNAVEGARNHIINAIIGLIVIFLSYLIVNILLAFVTGGQVSLSNIKLPTLGNPNF